MEKIYIGTKIIAARRMDECTFLKNFKNQDVGNQETRPGYKVRYEDGYIFWCPKETFERAYRELTSREFAMIIPSVVRINAEKVIDKELDKELDEAIIEALKGKEFIF